MAGMNEPRKPILQEIKLKGGQLVDTIKEIVEPGSARRVIIKNGEKTLVEFPLSMGVGGAAAALLIAPQLAAIGALAALLTDVSVIIEHDSDGDGDADSTTTLLGGKKGGSGAGSPSASGAGSMGGGSSMSGADSMGGSSSGGSSTGGSSASGSGSSKTMGSEGGPSSPASGAAGSGQGSGSGGAHGKG